MLIVKAMIILSLGPLTNMQPHIMNDIEIYLFFSGSYFMFNLNSIQTKVSASSPLQIFDSSLNITFIQLSTYHYCLSLAHFFFFFFCLPISAGFHSADFLLFHHKY